MAIFHNSLYIFFVFLTLLCLSDGRDFNVGGKDGWTLHPSESYSQWSSRLRFIVDDNLHFKYNSGSDSVLVVKKEDYDSCNTNSPIATLTGGDSVFNLNRPGPFYFISGNKSNCDQGQKQTVVVITPKSKQTPPPSPPGGGGSSSPGGSPTTSPGGGGGGASSPGGSPTTSPGGGGGGASSPGGSPTSSPGGGGGGASSPGGSPAASPGGGGGGASSPGGGPAASPGGGRVSSSPTDNPADSPGGAASSPTGNPSDTTGNGRGTQGESAARPAIGTILLTVPVAMIIFGLGWVY